MQNAIADLLNSQPNQPKKPVSMSALKPSKEDLPHDGAKRKSVFVEESLAESIAADSRAQVQASRLKEVAGNTQCADCGRDNPDWLSMNFGVLICLECSGIHRSMGVHISKVRSVSLDTLDDHSLNFLVRMGNAHSNSYIWEELLYKQAKDRGVDPAIFVANERASIIKRSCACYLLFLL